MNENTNPKKQRANMDVPLGLKDIEVKLGFEGFTRKSSTFCHETGVVGLSAFSDLDLSLLNHDILIDIFTCYAH